MKLAVIIPYRNRKRYLDILLDLLPKYLENNDIFDYKIFVSEQIDNYMFNIGISRNVGAKFALSQDNYDYFLFNDVDIIPVSGIDLSYSEKAVTWLMNGGGVKVPSKQFTEVCGFNILYNGWGCEEVDFWVRLTTISSLGATQWTTMEESKKAMMINLDMTINTEAESIAKSKKYFGMDGPRFIPYLITPISKANFYNPQIHRRNREILHFVESLSVPQLKNYCTLFGSRQIDLKKVRVKSDANKVCWLQYDKVDVLIQG